MQSSLSSDELCAVMGLQEVVGEDGDGTMAIMAIPTTPVPMEILAEAMAVALLAALAEGVLVEEQVAAMAVVEERVEVFKVLRPGRGNRTCRGCPYRLSGSLSIEE